MLKDLEPEANEVIICSEFTISNREWVCFIVNRPSVHNKLQCFFRELKKALSKASKSCKNQVLKVINWIN